MNFNSNHFKIVWADWETNERSMLYFGVYAVCRNMEGWLCVDIPYTSACFHSSMHVLLF